MFNRPAYTSLLLAALGLLTACGFQLRGSDGRQLPEDWYSMYLVTGNPNAELSRELANRFAANGVQWSEQRDQANYVLKLGHERFNRRNLSINAEARAAEFELTMKAQFSIHDREGNTVLEPSLASVVRLMENDPQNVVGKAEEIRILRGEMRTELSDQIMRRIGFYAISTQ